MGEGQVCYLNVWLWLHLIRYMHALIRIKHSVPYKETLCHKTVLWWYKVTLTDPWSIPEANYIFRCSWRSLTSMDIMWWTSGSVWYLAHGALKWIESALFRDTEYWTICLWSFENIQWTTNWKLLPLIKKSTLCSNFIPPPHPDNWTQ